jgi:nickel/cobalt transporter (NiCoT) family protein
VDALPANWSSLAVVVLLFGLKHGFDADHLATIDGLTRVTRRAGSAFSPNCGALFSLGHGAVVLVIAALVGSASERWETPAWLEASGAWISIAVLTLLGVLNVRAVFAASAPEVVVPVGLKGRLLGPTVDVRSPWVVMGIGAAFAVSFDTVSQAALFAATAVHFGGLQDALALAGIFLLGMLVIDGANGLWISRLISRADLLARVASRVMGLAVGSVSLLVAGIGAARLAAPAFARWTDEREILLGALVVAVVLTSFLVARRLAGRSSATEKAEGGSAS